MSDQEWTAKIPQLVPMAQTLDEPVVRDPERTAFELVSGQIETDQTCPIGTGARVAVTVGSRGIGGLVQIVRGIVSAVKAKGALPFIVPSMGSHGGEAPETKASLLAHLGITEESVGAPVSGTAEQVLAGHGSDGTPVYCQKEALDADAVILMNRVKPHTDFSGEFESGLVKIACVGLGGHLAAQWVHRLGYDHLGSRIKRAGSAAIDLLKIPFGLAIIEGHYGLPSYMEAVPADRISSREPELLDQARIGLLRLPINRYDLLVAGKMGKDISGLGLDSNITGRYPSGKPPKGENIPQIQRVVVLDLTDASKGNASGVGLADIATRRLFNKINFRAMYKNVITSRGSASAKIPMIMESDREAISAGLLTCHTRDDQGPSMILALDTLHLTRFMVSPNLVSQCEQAGAASMGPAEPLGFDSEGNLLWPDFMTSNPVV